MKMKCVDCKKEHEGDMKHKPFICGECLSERMPTCKLCRSVTKRLYKDGLCAEDWHYIQDARKTDEEREKRRKDFLKSAFKGECLECGEVLTGQGSLCDDCHELKKN